MVTPKDIKDMMGLQARKVCKTVLPNRPSAVTEKLTEFIVPSLPYSEVNKTMGEDDDWWVDMTVVYEIYVADIKTAANPNRPDSDRISDLITALKGLFPVVDWKKGFKIVRPRTVINESSDGNGYHFARVQAKMTTLV